MRRTNGSIIIINCVSQEASGLCGEGHLHRHGDRVSVSPTAGTFTALSEGIPGQREAVNELVLDTNLAVRLASEIQFSSNWEQSISWG